MKKIIVIILALFVIASLWAQEKKAPKESAFQFSFLTPIGTNGKESHLYTNTVSFNLLGGYSYANKAFELGSLYNINTGYTQGVQFAGLFNYSGEAKNAFQFAGLSNLSFEGTSHAQLAGFANITDTTNGVQLAGFGNISVELTGLQVASLLNITQSFTGAQLSSLANMSAGKSKGIQFSTSLNFADELEGAQFFAVENFAGSFIGGQFALFSNTAGVGKGVQVATVTNQATDITGMQLATILNLAKKVKGTQIGFINYAEEIEGVPIGLISIVKKGGKKEIEISASETLNTIVNFKLGVDSFYTIFSIGANFLGDTIEFAPGLGFGSQLNWNHGWANQIEAVAYQFTENSKFTNSLHMLTQVKLLTSKTLIGGLNIFVGPTLNISISQAKDSKGNFYPSLSPWIMWENDSTATSLRMWVGIMAGLSYRF